MNKSNRLYSIWQMSFLTYSFMCFGLQDLFAQSGIPPYQNQDTEKISRFVPEPSQLAGIIRYEIPRVTNKIKVSPESSVYAKLSLYFEAYFLKIDSLELSHKPLFDSLITSSRKSQVEFLASGDFGKMIKSIDSMKLCLEPVRQDVYQLGLALNAQLASILERKQYGKWLDYQEKPKMIFNPNLPMPMGGPPDEFLR